MPVLQEEVCEVRPPSEVLDRLLLVVPEAPAKQQEEATSGGAVNNVEDDQCWTEHRQLRR